MFTLVLWNLLHTKIFCKTAKKKQKVCKIIDFFIEHYLNFFDMLNCVNT